MVRLARSTVATPDPLVIIREAIAWARSRGLPVEARRDPGVVCTSGATSGLATWEADPLASSMCPLGAAVLKAQPQTTDLDEAVTIAVGVPVPWADGFAHGVTKQDASEAEGMTVGRAQYNAGYFAGVMAREYLHRAEVVNHPPSGQVS